MNDLKMIIQIGITYISSCYVATATENMQINNQI